MSNNRFSLTLAGVVMMACCGCTVKAVGDPNRPITIQAHITIDVKGLQQTATGIEDYVSGKTDTVTRSQL